MTVKDLSELSIVNGSIGKLRGCVNFFTFLVCDLLSFILALTFATTDSSDKADIFISSLLETGQLDRFSLYYFLTVVWVFWFGIFKKNYIQRKPFWTELWQIFTGVIFFCVMDAAAIALGKAEFSRSSWVSTWLLLLVFVPSLRHIGRVILRRLNMWQTPALIIGKGENAKEAYLALKSEIDMGFKVCAFVWPTRSSESNGSRHFKSPISAKPLVIFDDHMHDPKGFLPFHCVIALEANEWKLRDAIIRKLSQAGVADIQVIPAMRGVPLYGMETSHFFSHEVLMIQLRNNLANPLHRVCKRAFDLVGSLSLLILLSPVFAAIAYKVSKDGGKPFFGHVRVGQHNSPFKCYKFRSMVVDAQEVLAHLLATDPVAKAEWDQDFKLKNDPRVSKFGDFLRRSSLDELPQLWNVFKGDMSLVGPRPVVQAELERYGEDVDYYLMTKPGMTGLWQVSGRNDVDYATRVYLDSWYVKNWSLWSDIAILFKTISVVTKRNGAY
jgi:UDP-galactose-lipid carrier transferase